MVAVTTVHQLRRPAKGPQALCAFCAQPLTATGGLAYVVVRSTAQVYAAHEVCSDNALDIEPLR